jgi:hypothetical protein
MRIQKAWEVLGDCQVALKMLEEEKSLERWRIVWAAAVCLIRTVGHVLDKVDCANDPTLKKITAQHYQHWKGEASEHLIFREFIEKERNNILKEYQINIHPLEDVSVAVQGVLRPVDGGEAIDLADVFNIGENIYRPVVDGPWEGEDARDILETAIRWWVAELQLIEKETEIA